MKLDSDLLSDWLQRVYAMEVDFKQLFNSHLDSLPDSNYRTEVHKFIQNANERRQNLKVILGDFDENTNSLKTTWAKLQGSLKGTFDGMRSEDVLHALVSDLGMLQHGIALYRVCQLMADGLDNSDASQKLNQNMQQHLHLAETINQQFSQAVKNQLS